jgi:serine/threonine-protein kinase HipA
MSHSALFTLHQDLPREGPGSDACTREALRRLPALPPNPRVLDLGCGPGKQTRVLARELACRITAVDRHEPYLQELRDAAAREGLGDRIDTRCWDMADLPIEPGTADLIWSEGAAYNIGFENALRLWRPLLKPSGALALTECSWLTESPDEALRAFWDAAYPEIGTVDVNRERAEAVGYRVLDTFPLPSEAWWAEYYTPLQARIARLRPTADADLAAVLDEAEQEIALFQRYHTSYGYVFYLLAPAS